MKLLKTSDELISHMKIKGIKFAKKQNKFGEYKNICYFWEVKKLHTSILEIKNVYSKIINDEQIDTLYNIVESKVKEARDKILNTEFDINPKEMDDKNIGCKFCKYKDICYMTSSDIVKLKKIDNVFSEVNDNAKMD